MDNAQYNAEYKTVKVRQRRERDELDIKRWGSCPYYKGHFDLLSCLIPGFGFFFIGMLAGAILARW